MSERGSFTTHYFYCEKCYKNVLSLLRDEGLTYFSGLKEVLDIFVRLNGPAIQ